MKALIVIPARLKSTRLPEKMLADLHGKPLVVRTYEQAKKAKLADDVVIATDSERILEAVTEFGCKAILTPERIKTGTDRMAFAAQKLKADVFVNVQGDEPLINPKMIDSAIKPFLAGKMPDCSTLVQAITTDEEATLRNPNVVKVVLDREGFALYFSRSPIPYLRNSEAKIKFYRHIGLYAFRKETLLAFTKLKPSMLEQAESLEQLRLLENGYRIKCVETKLESQAVDTMEDLEKVRLLIKK